MCDYLEGEENLKAGGYSIEPWPVGDSPLHRKALERLVDFKSGDRIVIAKPRGHYVWIKESKKDGEDE